MEGGKRDANNRKQSHSNKPKQRPRRADRNREEKEIEELKEQCSEEVMCLIELSYFIHENTSLLLDHHISLTVNSMLTDSLHVILNS